MKPRRVIVLLGRRDDPTDAVEEYCHYLGAALEWHDFQLQIQRVPWGVYSWQASLDALRRQAAGWRDTWVLVQYTALAWSSRGFPQRFLRVLDILKSAGARAGVVYHDVEPFQGVRFIDRLRRHAQVHTMRRALHLADLAIFTVPPEKLSWLPGFSSSTHFIPVGPNLPIPETGSTPIALRKVTDTVPTGTGIPAIAVFSITRGKAGARETQIILAAVRHASQKLGKLRLSVFGRHAELRETDLRRGFQNVPVELSIDGVLEPAQVVQKLSASDVLLFVRGPISTRRGSAIAGIACGLPVIAYPGSETAVPITDAGVVLVSPDQPDELNAALVRVLSDASYRMDLATRSRAAYKTHFAWPAIAARYSALLNTR